jgi:RNA polymerase sigma-70 factor (ECF subfamily)
LDVDAEFETLFHTYQQPITTYLSHLLGDEERGEELAQEAFLRAYRAMVRGTEVAHPRAWLFRIATNAARDHWRRARLVRWLPLWGSEDDPALCTPDLADEVADRLDVRAALARLSPRYRVPLVLHLCEGLSTAEIAEVLGIRRGTVKMRLVRARRQLQCAFKTICGLESDHDGM